MSENSSSLVCWSVSASTSQIRLWTSSDSSKTGLKFALALSPKRAGPDAATTAPDASTSNVAILASMPRSRSAAYATSTFACDVPAAWRSACSAPASNNGCVNSGDRATKFRSASAPWRCSGACRGWRPIAWTTSAPPLRPSTISVPFFGRRSAIIASAATTCSQTMASASMNRSRHPSSSSNVPSTHMASFASSLFARFRNRPQSRRHRF
mmetsp:Transcript_1254/g.3509  ORF Transcript_1254/g.3509 Transcript_1254/m.3509 type:complete len:211 (+) Transcript_1254:194-826(+)